jgi:hypothetical protein
MPKQLLPLQGLKSAKPAPDDSQDGDSSSKATMVVPRHDVYQGPEGGDFRCDNCSYYVDVNTCNHPEIVKLQKGVVDPGGCCDYIERLGDQ